MPVIVPKEKYTKIGGIQCSFEVVEDKPGVNTSVVIEVKDNNNVIHIYDFDVSWIIVGTAERVDRCRWIGMTLSHMLADATGRGAHYENEAIRKATNSLFGKLGIKKGGGLKDEPNR